MCLEICVLIYFRTSEMYAAVFLGSLFWFIFIWASNSPPVSEQVHVDMQTQHRLEKERWHSIIYVCVGGAVF
jgi:hypothetical protein